MDLKTYYLKYRPQSFKELDLVEIRQGLSSLVKSGKIPHAFLFAGPKGTGKTSAARVLAKAVNCQKRQGYEPCNRCDICREITAGTSLDLIEMDAASNRGIDDIRDLREKIKLSPARCQYKVYIIDEAHMLTTEAFNALLKTLEEPPAHAIFILCTTRPEKLPDTIISRCTCFNFRKGKLAEVVGSLKKIVKGEKLKVGDGVLGAIAKSADGSFRDSQKLLEQLVLTGPKVSLKKTKKLLEQTEELAPKKLLALLAKRLVKASLLEIGRIVSSGGDLNVYLQRLLDSLRLAMLNKIGLEEVSGSAEINQLNIEEIKLLIKLFSQAYSEQKLTPIPQLPLELAVIEFCSQPKNNDSLSEKPKNNPSPQKRAKLVEVEAKWSEILAQVKPLNHSIEALLRACRPIKIDGQTLTLEVFYEFHKERLETEKCRQVFEEVASQILGNPIRLNCILGQKPASSSESGGNPDEDKDFKEGQEPAERQSIIDLANDIFNN